MFRVHADRRRIDWFYRAHASAAATDAERFVDLVNRAYYRHAAACYEERHTEDIVRQYRLLFEALELKARPDRVIVDIGGGTGFEYEQFLRNGVAWQEYCFIEPDEAMARQFRSRPDLGANVRICHGAFEQFAGDFRARPNKLLILSASLHHIVWIERFLDQVRECMLPGDLLLVCHEPNNRYYLSPLMLVGTLLRCLTTGLLPRKLGLWRSVRDRQLADRWRRINDDLIASRVTKDRLKPIVIRRIVDYGVGTKGDWKLCGIPGEFNEGYWTADEIAAYLGPSFRIGYLRTYRHFGEPGNGRSVELLNGMVERMMPRGGSVMCLAMEKTG